MTASRVARNASVPEGESAVVFDTTACFAGVMSDLTDRFLTVGNGQCFVTADGNNVLPACTCDIKAVEAKADDVVYRPCCACGEIHILRQVVVSCIFRQAVAAFPCCPFDRRMYGMVTDSVFTTANAVGMHRCGKIYHIAVKRGLFLPCDGTDVFAVVKLRGVELFGGLAVQFPVGLIRHIRRHGGREITV